MTNPQYTAQYTDAPVALPRPGRGLASGIAVFLGGYLLLAGFAGFLGQTSFALFGMIAGRPTPEYPASIMVLAALQFLFALLVVVVGLLLGRVSTPGALIGTAVVVVGGLLTFAVIGMRLNGLLAFPGGQAGIPFQAVFANPWFAIVLFVGGAWLLARGARLGWLSLLATLVLVPVPIALQFAGVESGIVQIVLFLLSGLVGAGIILAGRPVRD